MCMFATFLNNKVEKRKTKKDVNLGWEASVGSERILEDCRHKYDQNALFICIKS